MMSKFPGGSYIKVVTRTINGMLYCHHDFRCEVLTTLNDDKRATECHYGPPSQHTPKLSAWCSKRKNE